ncbi:hypothetical protein Sango_1128800 [Sesamum angolense]|uniref:RING-CH-type domain-containing protein n=1 Tax=Sesamum angolense TaxID=2727404 RepID=A0AAE1WW33_9LAMI|nr:hypothetical protein Sango_1128800 [Sesamum angolense]
MDIFCVNISQIYQCDSGYQDSVAIISVTPQPQILLLRVFLSYVVARLKLLFLLWNEVCQEETEEVLINLGCQCRGGLAKAHQSCIIKWFNTRGSNKCEICQQIAANVSPPDSQASAVMLSECISKIGAVFYSVSVSSLKSSRNLGIALLNYLLEQLFHVVSVPSVVAEIAIQVTGFGGLIQPSELNSAKGPLWVAFSILIGGLLLDVLISVTLGVSALPVNIIIGVIVVLGLGTALRLALEFCQEWNVRRVVQRVEANASLGYHPAL